MHSSASSTSDSERSRSVRTDSESSRSAKTDTEKKAKVIVITALKNAGSSKDRVDSPCDYTMVRKNREKQKKILLEEAQKAVLLADRAIEVAPENRRRFKIDEVIKTPNVKISPFTLTATSAIEGNTCTSAGSDGKAGNKALSNSSITTTEPKETSKPRINLAQLTATVGLFLDLEKNCTNQESTTANPEAVETENRRILTLEEAQEALNVQKSKCQDAYTNNCTLASQPPYNKISDLIQIPRSLRRELQPKATWPVNDSDPIFYYKKDIYKTRTSSGKAEVCRAIGHRTRMEDTHLVESFEFRGHTFSIFGIFDGHGNGSASSYLQSHFVTEFVKKLEESSLQAHPVPPPEDIIYNSLKQSLVDLHYKYVQLDAGGTTVNIALIANDYVYVANIGDSRSILVDSQGNGIQLSEDAKPTDPRHKKIIEQGRGIIGLAETREDPLTGTVTHIWKVNGILGLGSSFGDRTCVGINPTVDITKTQLPASGCTLMIACDGIWNMITSEQACNLLHKRPDITSEELAHLAYINGSQDNLSAILVKIPGTMNLSMDSNLSIHSPLKFVLQTPEEILLLRKQAVVEENWRILTLKEVQKALDEQQSRCQDAYTYNCNMASQFPYNKILDPIQIPDWEPKQKLSPEAPWRAKNHLEKPLFAFKQYEYSINDCTVDICESIGGRPTMEDEHLTISFELMGHTFSVFGVFDGHSDGTASIYVRDHFIEKFKQKLEEFSLQAHPVPPSEDIIYNSLKIALVKLHDDYVQLGAGGTTVNIALIANHHVYVANIGDSRSILVDSQGMGIQLSEDAKPTDPRHQKTIKDLGGNVVYSDVARVSDMIAMGSSFGDRKCQGMNPTVDITRTPLPNSGCILLIACDGIWDAITSEQACKLLHKRPDITSKELACLAYVNGRGDNLSAILVKIPARPLN